jgi:hypothetical protein
LLKANVTADGIIDRRYANLMPGQK